MDGEKIVNISFDEYGYLYGIGAINRNGGRKIYTKIYKKTSKNVNSNIWRSLEYNTSNIKSISFLRNTMYGISSNNYGLIRKKNDESPIEVIEELRDCLTRINNIKDIAFLGSRLYGLNQNGYLVYITKLMGIIGAKKITL